MMLWLDDLRQDIGYAFRTLRRFAACYLPARRATTIDPVVALRSE